MCRGTHISLSHASWRLRGRLGIDYVSMCGIYGFNLDFFKKDPAQVELLAKSLNEKLKHRGPDSYGFLHLGNNFLLGNTRLALNDLSDLGKQPILDSSGRYAIVLNGEIYNFHELRNELVERGVLFGGNSDTEVVVKGFAIDGDAFLRKLRGMFSLAIFDQLTFRLTLMRDYFGEKPLWYTVNGVVAFASEYMLVELILKYRSINRPTLSTFLEFGYFQAPTLSEGVIKSVAPGSIVEIDTTVNEICKETKRDDFNTLPQLKLGTWKEKVDALDFLLKRKVEEILNCSDVEIGILLSEGIDSNLVASYVSALKPNSKAFTLVFANDTTKQQKYRESLFRNWKIDLYEVKFSTDFELVKETIRRMPLPIADSSALAQFQICRFAGSFVKACISGDGADEMFAGYETYQASLLLGKLPVPFRKLLSKLSIFAESVSNTENYFSQSFTSPLTSQEKLARFLKYASSDLRKSHSNWRRIFDEIEIRSLSSSEILRSRSHSQNKEPRMSESILNNLQEFDVENWLTGDVLFKTDAMSMASSLELRTPFLSQELWTFAKQLDDRDKATIFSRKRILYELLNRKVADTSLSRKKIGFGVPLSEIISENLEEIKTCIVESNLWEEKSILELLTRHRTTYECRKIYTLFVLSFWFTQVYSRDISGEQEFK